MVKEKAISCHVTKASHKNRLLKVNVNKKKGKLIQAKKHFLETKAFPSVNDTLMNGVKGEL